MSGFGSSFVLVLSLLSFQGASLEPGTRQGPESGTPVRAHAMPWLVSVVHHVSVDRLLSDFSQRGWKITVPDDVVAQGRLITNVTTGIVMDRDGQVLARLVNASPNTNPANVTVTTNDGRALHPESIQFEESTGYTVLRVPGLNVDPPAFAGEWKIESGGERVRLVYQVPDKLAVVEALEARVRASGSAVAKPQDRGARRSGRPLPKTRLREAATWVTVPDPLPARESAAAADTGSLSVEPALIPVTKEIRPIEVASLTSETDGGVVVNSAGKVLGVAQFVPPDRGVLKSVAELRALVEQLNFQRVAGAKGYLGLKLRSLVDLAAHERQRLNAPAEGGLLVSEVIDGGPAAKAGLKSQDVILSLNDERVAAPGDLGKLISTVQIGTEMPIRVLRDGATRTFQVQLAERPGSPTPGQLQKLAGQAPAIVARNELDLAPEGRSVGGGSAADVLTSVGFHAEQLSPQLRQYFGIRDGAGVMVTEVSAESPAYRAGLRAGDIIVRLNETDIGTPRGLSLVLRQLLNRRLVSFEVIRDRKSHLFILPIPARKVDSTGHTPNR
ncbi:MAG: PDZ domain-containing protein [Acidobacteria bacterium]|nr:PDZ domain-containing protein [Acidobacteriota bacterium]